MKELLERLKLANYEPVLSENGFDLPSDIIFLRNEALLAQLGITLKGNVQRFVKTAEASAGLPLAPLAGVRVDVWLESIGLGHYYTLFEEEGFDDLADDLVGSYNDELLQKLGISKVGHRLRLLNALGATELY